MVLPPCKIKRFTSHAGNLWCQREESWKIFRSSFHHSSLTYLHFRPAVIQQFFIKTRGRCSGADHNQALSKNPHTKARSEKSGLFFYVNSATFWALKIYIWITGLKKIPWEKLKCPLMHTTELKPNAALTISRSHRTSTGCLKRSFVLLPISNTQLQ